jgi:hypothetical protein
MKAQQQFTLVLPFKISGYHGANELGRLTGILLPSLYKFMDTNAVHTFFIICKDNEVETVEAALAGKNISIHIQVRSENTILKPETIANTKGWYIQQLVKLGVAKIITTEYYLVLDADCFLTRSFSYESLFCDHKLITNTESWTVHKDWWLNSLDILEMSVDQISNNPVIAATPQTLKTGLVRQLLDFIDEKAGHIGWETYLSERKFTEFSLYWLFLIRHNLTHLYHSGSSPVLLGNALWNLYHPQKPGLFARLLPKRFRPGRTLSEENTRLIRQHIDACFQHNGDSFFSLVQSNIDGISVEWLSGQLQKYLRPNESAQNVDAGENP